MDKWLVLRDIAKTLRGLSIDAVEAAGCGHPGLPLGCADLMAYLYGVVLRHNPKDPKWINRDRFVLSAGHGSALLYATLHVSGFDLSLDDVKNFRQLHSKTPGHPEYLLTPGVETTTGPLGQGLATATGIALGQKMSEARFEVASEKLLDAKVYVLVGDGDLMEGITSESSSLAGHLCLDNLIVIYDSNDICLDGTTAECFTENTRARYEAYGWLVLETSGHDFDQIHSAFSQAQLADRPVLIIAKTLIGCGAPSVQGSNEAHGKALGAEETLRAKENLGISTTLLFDVPVTVSTYFNEKQARDVAYYEEWQRRFLAWSTVNLEKSRLWKQCIEKSLVSDLDAQIQSVVIKPNLATRQSSNAVLQVVGKALPWLVVGSADLSSSDNTLLSGMGTVATASFEGRNIKYGVREFAMGAMSTGLSLHGMLSATCGTFLTFSDYMRNAIRLSALMKQKVVYHFTHDSVFLGEDGPTHQPVEHVASLRAMPGLVVIRPADATEVRGAWSAAVREEGPVALILSRLGVPDLTQSSFEGVARGAYVVKSASRTEIDYCLFATGAEVSLALDVAAYQEAQGYSVKVVSVPSFELFDRQDSAYRASILDGQVKQFWAIEAGTSFGWHRFVGREGHVVSIDIFGESAPAPELKKYFGFTVEAIVERMRKVGI